MVFLIAAAALRIYTMLFWARFIMEWVLVINPRFSPKGLLLMVVELLYTLTDPPLKLVRKVVPPLRVGQIMLDIAMVVVLFGLWFLIQILYVLAATF